MVVRDVTGKLAGSVLWDRSYFDKDIQPARREGHHLDAGVRVAWPWLLRFSIKITDVSEISLHATCFSLSHSQVIAPCNVHVTMRCRSHPCFSYDRTYTFAGYLVFFPAPRVLLRHHVAPPYPARRCSRRTTDLSALRCNYYFSLHKRLQSAPTFTSRSRVS